MTPCAIDFVREGDISTISQAQHTPYPVFPIGKTQLRKVSSRRLAVGHSPDLDLFGRIKLEMCPIRHHEIER